MLKPRSELFNVADMEYTLAELVKETKSNDRELLKSLLKSHEQEISELKGQYTPGKRVIARDTKGVRAIFKRVSTI